MELCLEFAGHGIVDGAGNQYSAYRGLRFESGSNVHAVAIEVIAIDDEVAKMQADAEDDPVALGPGEVGLGDGLLELDRGAERVHGATEGRERAVARQLDEAATVTGKRGLEQLATIGLEARERAALVATHLPRIPNHVGGQNRCKSPLLAYQWFSPVRGPERRGAARLGQRAAGCMS